MANTRYRRSTNKLKLHLIYSPVKWNQQVIRIVILLLVNSDGQSYFKSPLHGDALRIVVRQVDRQKIKSNLTAASECSIVTGKIIRAMSNKSHMVITASEMLQEHRGVKSPW